MKRWRVWLLSALLAVNPLLPALAAEVPTVRLNTEKTEIMSGEEIEITLELDRDVENIGSLEYRLHYDRETLDYVEGSAVNPALHVIVPAKERMYAGALFSYDYAFPESSAQEREATRIPSGELVKLRFQAKNVSHSTPAEFRLEKKAAESVDFIPVNFETSDPLTVTVTPRPGYSAGIRIPENAAVGEKLTAYIDVSANGYDNFNASQILISYDSTRLRYEGSGSNIYSCETVSDGILRIADFGNTEELKNGVYAIDFTAITGGEAEISLTKGECGFSPLMSAAKEDLLQAALIKDTAKISISEAQHKVTLPKGFSGSSWVFHGSDYTFTRSNDADCYDYGPVSAQADGKIVSVTENEDGSYTVENVTGELVISGTRSPRTFAVHVAGSGEKETTAEESAVYLRDYSFTVKKQSGYGYTVTVTIGGQPYTGITNDGNLFTIPGRDIRGDILINVEKKSTGGEDVYRTWKVTVTGNAGEDVEAKAAAESGKDYSFTLSKQENYTYTLSITIDGAPYTGYSYSGTVYTIPGRDIKGNIVIRAERTKPVDEEPVKQYTVDVYGSGGDDVGAKATAEAGKNYSFTLSKRKNCTYRINITINGAPYTDYSHSGTTYTIPGRDINGDIVIRVSRTELAAAERYMVTVSGNAEDSISAYSGENAASYGTDYSFTLRKNTGYTYNVLIEIGGETYSGYLLKNNTYTIPGEDITGDIVITAMRKTNGAAASDAGTGNGETSGTGTDGGRNYISSAGGRDTYSSGNTDGGSDAAVAVEGSASGAVTAAATTALRKDFGFSVKMEEGYEYSVAAYVNGTEVEVTDRGSGRYRISAENVTGDILLRVDKTPKGETLIITHYLTLNDTELYLLRYTPNRERGSVPCLDGTRMYESSVYGSFALLIATAEEPVREELAKRITFEKADAQSLDYSGDLNMSGHPDILDAEMILDIYNLVYASPSALPDGMEIYLRADLNHDGVVNCLDAAAAMKLADR